ncbi:hypothetical protein E1189_00385 [Sansalvadorimonas verongulae]|nr:hypothetical protein [Sansalvadorimonas verongulae]
MTTTRNHYQWNGVYEHYLRTAFRSHDALVLDEDDLTIIAQEFISGLKLDTGSISLPKPLLSSTLAASFSALVASKPWPPKHKPKHKRLQSRR